MGDFEQRLDAIGNADDAKSAAGTLAGGEGTDDGSETGRIHIGNVRDVDDQRLAVVAPGEVLKVKQRSQSERAGEPQDAGAFGTNEDFDAEIFGTAWSHKVILYRSSRYKSVTNLSRRWFRREPCGTRIG